LTGDGIDPTSPLFRPISIADAMAATGKSKRTIDRWIREGHLRKVRLDDEVVLIEDDVLGYEKRMSDNLNASRTVSPGPPQPAT
jgi:hypothetical protein